MGSGVLPRDLVAPLVGVLPRVAVLIATDVWAIRRSFIAVRKFVALPAATRTLVDQLAGSIRSGTKPTMGRAWVASMQNHPSLSGPQINDPRMLPHQITWLEANAAPVSHRCVGASTATS